MTRILTAAVLFAIVIPVLIFSHTVVFPIFLAVAGVMCVWETSRCKGLHKKWYIWLPAALYVALSPFAPWLFWNMQIWIALTAVFLVYIFFSGVFYYGKVNITDLAFIALFGLYISVGVFSVATLRRYVPSLYLLVFIAPWVSDAMAMYSGKLFGKRKLCPNISPKKTVAGAVGSMLGTVLAVAVYIFVVNTWFDGDFSYLVFILLAIPAGVIIQLGDLSASVVKRSCGVKDYGNLLPGHGGIMDRCDSILPTAVYGWIVMYLAANFTDFFSIA